jgi:hypothetical protein
LCVEAAHESCQQDGCNNMQRWQHWAPSQRASQALQHKSESNVTITVAVMFPWQSTFC